VNLYLEQKNKIGEEHLASDQLNFETILTQKDINQHDFIFLDPPYDDHSLPGLLPACKRLLTTGGLVYIESDQPFATSPLPDWLSGWQLVRADKAGAVHFALICKD
jgi:16S rRNA G966 N2-methylase RsmD